MKYIVKQKIHGRTYAYEAEIILKSNTPQLAAAGIKGI